MSSRNNSINENDRMKVIKPPPPTPPPTHLPLNPKKGKNSHIGEAKLNFSDAVKYHGLRSYYEEYIAIIWGSGEDAA